MHHFIKLPYKPYPAIRYYDMLDALARMLDQAMMVAWPKPKKPNRDIYDQQNSAGGDSWMAG